MLVINQVGYFVHNDYESEELRETPPETPDLTQPITRSLFVILVQFDLDHTVASAPPETVLTFYSGISWQKNPG